MPVKQPRSVVSKSTSVRKPRSKKDLMEEHSAYFHEFHNAVSNFAISHNLGPKQAEFYR